MSTATPLPRAAAPVQGDELPTPAAPVRDPDPFDPAALRLAPDFEAVGVKRVIVAVPVRKPGKQEFVRVHPDEDYRLETGLIELEEERETYLVHPRPARGAGGRDDASSGCTSRSRGRARCSSGRCRCPAPTAGATRGTRAPRRRRCSRREHWVRLKANMAAGTYDIDAAARRCRSPSGRS